MRRLFVAVDITDEMREEVARYIDRLRTESRDALVAWERAEKLHFTLKFIGNFDEAKLEQLRLLLMAAASDSSPFSVRVCTPGVFPSIRKPRIIWLGIDKPDQFRTLAEKVDSACARLGIETETRPFRPHLTIGRVREPRSARTLAEHHTLDRFGPVEIDVGEIVLYQSTLHRTGSVYTKLQQFPLKQPND